MKLTRREKHVLVAAAIILAIMFIFNPPLPVDQAQEWFYLLFVVAPIGFYIATDPEHR